MKGRLPGIVVNALLILLATAVALGALELVLRARPTLLGAAYANGVLSKYTDGEGGIFYKDRQAGTRFMIPNFTTQMYYNGFTWTHQTDALGFRNQPLSIPADIVLLGDSYIYGHGLELESTVGVQLARLTGLSVANLARQGDCALQQAYLVTESLPIFEPRYVLYFFSENDIADLYVFLDDASLRASSLWLPGDGHPSPGGARKFAELAAAYVSAHPAPPRGASAAGAGGAPPGSPAARAHPPTSAGR